MVHEPEQTMDHFCMKAVLFLKKKKKEQAYQQCQLHSIAVYQRCNRVVVVHGEALAASGGGVAKWQLLFLHLSNPALTKWMPSCPPVTLLACTT